MNQHELSGIMEAMLSEKREGRMTREEQMIFLSNQVADNLFWNKPLHLQPFQDDLLNYAKRRTARHCERDPDMHRRLGSVVTDMRETHAENKVRLGQLHWAKEYLHKVKLTDQVAKLDEAIKGFKVFQPSESDQSTIVRALSMDSHDKSLH